MSADSGNVVLGAQETTGSSPEVSPNGQPRSLGIAQNGIRTGQQFAALMSALMSDLIDGSITPAVGNAAVNAGGKLLKIAEMQHKYGTTHSQKPRIIDLVPDKV